MAPATIVKPDRIGTQIQFRGVRSPVVPPGFSDAVALPIVHDWGPLNELVECTSFADFIAKYGDSDTPGRTAVFNAFLGQGLPGGGGAGSVQVYRMGRTSGSPAVKATHTFQNTAGTPANALKIDAAYEGVRGNRISIAIGNDPRIAGNDRLQVLLDATVVEAYSYVEDDLASLAAAINSRSTLVAATVLADGVTLGATAGTTLSTGADGSTLTGAEWTAAMTALTFAPFSFVAPYDLTDATIKASMVAWIQSQVAAGRPAILVLGGGSSDTVDTAIADALLADDPHVVRVGAGQYHDDVLDADLTTSQLASRVAGVLAQRGEESSGTFARLGGLHVVGATGPSSEDIRAATTHGVTVFSIATADDADLKIEMAVTSFTDDSDPDRPLDVFSDSRLVHVMDVFLRGIKQWGDDKAIGALPVNDDTRATVRGEVGRRINDLRDRGLILANPKPTVDVLNTDNDPANRDVIPFTFGWQFARTANYLLGFGSVI